VFKEELARVRKVRPGQKRVHSLRQL
jgi:hypothetical protein